MLGAAGIGILGSLTGGSDEEVGQVISQGIDLSNDIMEYFEMKYSRKHEHEADHIGMILMAMAGYDPHEAPMVWVRMTQAFGDNTNRILSTHPSNAKRQRWMETKWMDEAMSYYNKRTGRNVSQNRNQRISNVGRNSNATNETGTYVVQASKLNVRSSPSASNSKVVGTLLSGQIVKVKAIKNGWATIDYKEKNCYVKADYLKRK